MNSTIRILAISYILVLNGAESQSLPEQVAASTIKWDGPFKVPRKISPQDQVLLFKREKLSQETRQPHWHKWNKVFQKIERQHARSFKQEKRDKKREARQQDLENETTLFKWYLWKLQQKLQKIENREVEMRRDAIKGLRNCITLQRDINQMACSILSKR